MPQSKYGGIPLDEPTVSKYGGVPVDETAPTLAPPSPPEKPGALESILNSVKSEGGEALDLLKSIATYKPSVPVATGNEPTRIPLLDTVRNAFSSAIPGGPQTAGTSLVDAVKQSPVVRTVQGIRNSINSIRPSLVKAAVSPDFNMLDAKYGTTAIPTGDATASAMKLEDLGKHGFHPPDLVSDYLKMRQQGPITYSSGRLFAQKAGELSAEEGRLLEPRIKAEVGNFGRILDQANPSIMTGEHRMIYNNAMSEWARASRIEDKIAVARKYAPWVIGAATVGGGAGYLKRQALKDLINP